MKSNLNLGLFVFFCFLPTDLAQVVKISHLLPSTSEIRKVFDSLELRKPIDRLKEENKKYLKYSVCILLTHQGVN
ncbi:hypothetical protein FHQ18_07480 [Deferribacter autotrophicus]|uniref:Uncharacterized protein n=1 Tax=Deferribacter autotrophicus TaxID=500465 RepID=A0A5A8F5A7_9BACT|nr:hypothetical protein [Deferribacter autotrophicus]KAA0258225.1 hypothetical protein FHQ18_07480 [Deferribacter autotrophicus]